MQTPPQSAYALVKARRNGRGADKHVARLSPGPHAGVDRNGAPFEGEPAVGVAEIAQLSGLPAHVVEALTKQHRISCLRLPGMGDFYYWSQVRRDLEAFRLNAIHPEEIPADFRFAAPPAA